MKILKVGDLRPMIFECDNCSCVFEADVNDYKRYKIDFITGNESNVWYGCDCPTCYEHVMMDANEKGRSKWVRQM